MPGNIARLRWIRRPSSRRRHAIPWRAVQVLLGRRPAPRDRRADKGPEEGSRSPLLRAI